MIRDLLTFEPRGVGTRIDLALSYLGRVHKRKAVVFLVSDFLSEQDFERPLRVANQRHDLVAFQVSDPREKELPDVGFVAIEDAEDGRNAWIDTSSAGVRRNYAKAASKRNQGLQSQLRRLDVDLVQLSTHEPVVGPLVRYFRRRERRL